MVEQLLAQRQKLPTASASPTVAEIVKPQVNRDSETAIPSLHVLVRTAEQLDAAIKCQPASITLDYLELYGLRPSVEKIKQAGIAARVASPRILKPNEQKIIRFLLSLECQILIRSGGLLHDLVQPGDSKDNRPALSGDFSLNAANALSCNYYLQLGLERLSPTHDLNAQQIIDLANDVGWWKSV